MGRVGAACRRAGASLFAPGAVFATGVHADITMLVRGRRLRVVLERVDTVSIARPW